jgi:hypothetical protein
MTMSEIVTQMSFELGLPANQNIEELEPETAVTIAFRELKRYMKTPVEYTVPFQTRMDLVKLGIKTRRVLAVIPAYPRLGLSMGTIDSGNVFQVAAAMNAFAQVGNASSMNIDPIMIELGMAQVRNTISTDFQWHYDINNQIVMCTHRDPRPAVVTIRYVPDYQDVSEINNMTWIDYLIRLAEAHWKKAIGRARSKYKIEGSNVQLDGELLLSEANAELEQLRSELESKKQKLVFVN